MLANNFTSQHMPPTLGEGRKRMLRALFTPIATDIEFRVKNKTHDDDETAALLKHVADRFRLEMTEDERSTGWFNNDTLFQFMAEMLWIKSGKAISLRNLVTRDSLIRADFELSTHEQVRGDSDLDLNVQTPEIGSRRGGRRSRRVGMFEDSDGDDNEQDEHELLQTPDFHDDGDEDDNSDRHNLAQIESQSRTNDGPRDVENTRLSPQIPEDGLQHSSDLIRQVMERVVSTQNCLIEQGKHIATLTATLREVQKLIEVELVPRMKTRYSSENDVAGMLAASFLQKGTSDHKVLVDTVRIHMATTPWILQNSKGMEAMSKCSTDLKTYYESTRGVSVSESDWSKIFSECPPIIIAQFRIQRTALNRKCGTSFKRISSGLMKRLKDNEDIAFSPGAKDLVTLCTGRLFKPVPTIVAIVLSRMDLYLWENQELSHKTGVISRFVTDLIDGQSSGKVLPPLKIIEARFYKRRLQLFSKYYESEVERYKVLDFDEFQRAENQPDSD